MWILYRRISLVLRKRQTEKKTKFKERKSGITATSLHTGKNKIKIHFKFDPFDDRWRYELLSLFK